MEKKKLCLVIPSLQAGGMERVMSELAGYFAAREELEVHLILYSITREIFYPIPKRVIIHKPSFRFNKQLKVLSTLKTLYYLRSTVKSIMPYVILSFGEYWNSFLLISIFGLRYPVFVSDRCQPNKSLGKFHDWLRKKLYPQATGIIAQTERAKNIFLSQFRHDNIIVIGNPIKTISKQNRIVRDNIVLMVGRLIETKHQDKLIELFLKISKPSWKLVIVGYDHLKQNNSEKLRKIIFDNHAEGIVMLEGKQIDVERYYLISRIFAFTSSSEGFPNVIGEAMSAGLPVIAFDCVAGPSELIKDNENGFLIPLFDYNLFQKKLEVLMENDELRISFGKEARKNVRQFSIDNIGEQYLKHLLN